METAVNALWDAAPLVGDRVTVVGARHGRLLRRARCSPGSPACEVELVDVDAGAGRASPPRSASTSPSPADAAGGRDLVVHASATAAGLQRSLDLLAPEGTVLELSWYGDRRGQRCRWAGRSTPAGSPSARSQVGTRRAGPRRAAARTPTAWRSPWTCSRDPAFDALITGESRFDELPDVLARLAAGRPARALPPHHLRRGE